MVSPGLGSNVQCSRSSRSLKCAYDRLSETTRTASNYAVILFQVQSRLLHISPCLSPFRVTVQYPIQKPK
jgi:hypothetical protein